VGELSLLDGSPRSATVRPKDGAIRVLRISGARFRSRLLPRSRVAQSLLVTLAQRIRDLSRRVMRD
jgi:CRP-like cAMP-binding protein